MYKTQNLYQNDPKWKDVNLGNSTEKIGGWGCLLTSVTMMLNGLGYNDTPEAVNEKMKKAGGFQGAFFIPSVLPYVFPNVAYKGMQPCEASPAPIAQIDAAVAAGKPVILQVDWNKDAGIQTHFVLVKERKGDDYVLYDPYMYKGDGPDKEVLLTQRYRFNGQTLEKEISGVLWFDGTTPPPPPTQTRLPLPVEKFVVYVVQDDLALRAQPSPAGYLWKRMLSGAELICLEDKAAAQAKIGAQGQWLQVQDDKGNQGYCAAWYVSATKGAPPTPAATQPTSTTATPTTATTTTTATRTIPPGALLLLPTEELSFRTRPVVSPDTLIRRLPVTEQLICIEPSSAAIAKVGVTNQWLNVRDTRGRDGFVAAWFVKYASGSTAQAQAQPAAATPTTTVASATATAGGPIKVKATAEGLAFRTQPVFSDATLIRRLPLGTELTLVNATESSLIGSNQHYLKVKDTTGKEGFVAAWFVAR